MSRRPTGKRAFGFSDRSEFRYPLKDLVPQIINRKNSGLLVGRDEADKDHPQWQLGSVNTSEALALLNPRPDKEVVESRGLSAWEPVGGGVTEMGSRTVGLNLLGSVGRARVSTAPSPWILAGGAWDDDGRWIDTEVWID